ncbi:MAG TPA: phage/plasmid primase, P4 family [Terriglobales bacterium]|nr:phage/plasmid primase, P4 family [Terriglobales bacterium]
MINVYRVKGDKSSGKILELKLHNQSVAAPTAERFADGKKCAGIYGPRACGAKMRRGIARELLTWLEEHGEVNKPHEKSGANRVDFHPQFERERFLECHDCTEDRSGMVDDALHVVVECCPLCGKDARESTVAAGVSKFIFGGYSFGFVCHACGVNSKEELEEALLKLSDGFEPWGEFIYRDDDPQFLLNSFGAEEASLNEESADSTKEIAARLPPEIFALTDMGNAERFEWRYGDKFAFTAATGWLVYDGGVWSRDVTKTVVRAMQTTVRLIEPETELVNTGSEETDKAMRNAIIGWAKRSESSSKIKAALEQASALGTFAKDYGDFDRKPHLLNVKNGTIDLNTSEFMHHDPKHLLTKQSTIEFDPNAKCPKWEQFVLDIMGGKRHMQQYLCRCAGYTLTADTSGQCVFVPWGPGGTGKSTFLSVMRGVMGDYCKQADAEMFMVKRGDSGQPFEMAGMEGTRLLMAVETEQGKKLALAKLKKMTGQDPITACYKFQHQYEFVPPWKVWLATNDAPTTRADDDAWWDRAKPIPFNVKFRRTEGEIKNYAEILLKEEGPGILNWCLAGVAAWRREGLNHPEDVAQAADAWRDRDDWLQRFIDEHLEATSDPEQYAIRSKVFERFSGWADTNKEARSVNHKNFMEAIRRKGFKDESVKQKGKTQRVWVGWRLKTSVEQGVGATVREDTEELGI